MTAKLSESENGASGTYGIRLTSEMRARIDAVQERLTTAAGAPSRAAIIRAAMEVGLSELVKRGGARPAGSKGTKASKPRAKAAAPKRSSVSKNRARDERRRLAREAAKSEAPPAEAVAEGTADRSARAEG